MMVIRSHVIGHAVTDATITSCPVEDPTVCLRTTLYVLPKAVAKDSPRLLPPPRPPGRCPAAGTAGHSARQMAPAGPAHIAGCTAARRTCSAPDGVKTWPRDIATASVRAGQPSWPRRHGICQARIQEGSTHPTSLTAHCSMTASAEAPPATERMSSFNEEIMYIARSLQHHLTKIDYIM